MNDETTPKVNRGAGRLFYRRASNKFPWLATKAANRAALTFAVLLPITIALFGIWRVTSMDKHSKAGSCYRDGVNLSTEQLRLRVIRNLFEVMTDSSEGKRADRIRDGTFLIARSMTADDVIDAIDTKSLSNLDSTDNFVGKSSRIERESAAMEVDSDFEVIAISEAAGALLHGGYF